MTLTDTDRRDLGEPPAAVVTEVDGIPMAGLLSVAPRPRATVIALHGGATTARYFDCPGHPDLSLLRVAAAAGYTVLALDRPGYGQSTAQAGHLADPRSRVDLVYTAADRLLDGLDRGAGTFVVAHSAGSELALQMAADERGADLLGLELAGTGREHQPDAELVLWGGAGQRGPIRRDGVPGGPRLRQLLWEPAELYPPDIVGGAAIAAYVPPYEAAVVGRWRQHTLPEVAARVRIPVRLTAGDHERVWRNDPAGLAEVAAAFTAAPRVVVNIQVGSGHNLSLGRGAVAYHTQLLSFVEECVAHDASPSTQEEN